MIGSLLDRVIDWLIRIKPVGKCAHERVARSEFVFGSWVECDDCGHRFDDGPDW